MFYICRRLFSSSAQKGGTLFTWGKSTVSLGRPQTGKSQPKALKGFNNVLKASMGPSHSAFITADGNVFTFGEGADGQLGHNDGGKAHLLPKMIDFFHKKNLKAIDVDCGDRHTAVLTSDGDVWTFGWGGRKLNWLMRIFVSAVGPLGHGDNKSHHTPTPVEQLRKHPKIVQISCGSFFTMALNKNAQLFNWGRGEYGVFGDGENVNHQIPMHNKYFQYLEKEEKITIKRIKSSSSYSIALMSNNRLYGWGSNSSGQIGVESEIGVQMYETCNFATAIDCQGLKEQSVVDFDISQNALIFKLENGDIWWSGMKLIFRPEKLLVDTSKPIDNIGACRNSLVAISGDRVQYRGDFVQITKEENVKTGVKSASVQDLFGVKGNILSVGGGYNNKYTIIEEQSQPEATQAAHSDQKPK